MLIYLYQFIQFNSVDYVRPQSGGGSPIGRHSEQRTQKRNDKLAFHEEEDTLVTALMEEFNTSEAGRKSPIRVRETSLGNDSNLFRPGEFMVKPNIGGEYQSTTFHFVYYFTSLHFISRIFPCHLCTTLGLSQRERTPNSKVGSDMLTHSGTSSIGTSQIPGLCSKLIRFLLQLFIVFFIWYDVASGYRLPRRFLLDGYQQNRAY